MTSPPKQLTKLGMPQTVMHGEQELPVRKMLQQIVRNGDSDDRIHALEHIIEHQELGLPSSS
jgi:hypothetical protein